MMYIHFQDLSEFYTVSYKSVEYRNFVLGEVGEKFWGTNLITKVRKIEFRKFIGGTDSSIVESFF